MDKPLRVLKVLGSTGLGGAENMVMNYFYAMDKSQVQFDFLLNKTEYGSRDDEIINLGGRVHFLPPIKILNYFKYRRAVKKFFSENHYQVVHSHTNAYGYWVLKEAKKNNVPLRIIHSHTSIEPFFKKIFLKNKDWSATLKEIFQSILKRQAVKQATHFFACGEKAGLWMFGKKNKGNFTIINNSINTDLFKFDPVVGNKIKSELFPRNSKIIGHVGNFTEAKNHKFLIDVFYNMLKKQDDLILVLVGEGSLRSEIEKKVQKLGITEKVYFLGCRDDVPALLMSFDLIVFPSLYEGLPLSLIEAQTSGVKILASKNITEEIAITNLIEFYNLDNGYDKWASKALGQIKYERKNVQEQIISRGYDIKASAKKLQEFYLQNS